MPVKPLSEESRTILKKTILEFPDIQHEEFVKKTGVKIPKQQFYQSKHYYKKHSGTSRKTNAVLQILEHIPSNGWSEETRTAVMDVCNRIHNHIKQFSAVELRSPESLELRLES